MVMMNTRKSKDLIQFTLLVLALVGVNVFFSSTLLRMDLTEDQRFSIDKQTIATLEELPGIVHVEVFLEGEMPSGYRQLAKGIKEKLQDLNSYSDGKIDVEFTDPFGVEDTLKKGLFDFLKRSGLKSITVKKTIDGTSSSKALFPGAVLTYKGTSIALNLLKKDKVTKGNQGVGSLNRNEIERSLNELEFEFVEGLKMIAIDSKKKLLFLGGHGELGQRELKDVEKLLSSYYQLFIDRLSGLSQEKINEFDMLVIARPQSEYSELDKYKLDQYLMQGGNVVCFIDAVEKQMTESGVLGKPYALNLRDLLFRYGVRLNDEIVLDLSSTSVPMDVDGNFVLVPSTFFPKIVSFNQQHKITKDLSAVKSAEFIGSLDTVTTAKGVKKIPLFFSSQYARKWGAPVVITPHDFANPIHDRSIYTSSYLPLAYLLEGDFTSFYKNKPLPKGASAKTRKNKSGGLGKMIIVGDGDFIANTLGADQKTMKPAGYDVFERKTYQNLIFFNNAIDYLLENNFISNKSSSFKARPLDQFKIKEEKEKWQIINLVAPNLLVILVGLIAYFIRKKRYANF
jgi:ABC-2 type transport system permease protein